MQSARSGHLSAPRSVSLELQLQAIQQQASSIREGDYPTTELLTIAFREQGGQSKHPYTIRSPWIANQRLDREPRLPFAADEAGTCRCKMYTYLRRIAHCFRTGEIRTFRLDHVVGMAVDD